MLIYVFVENIFAKLLFCAIYIIKCGDISSSDAIFRLDTISSHKYQQDVS